MTFHRHGAAERAFILLASVALLAACTSSPGSTGPASLAATPDTTAGTPTSPVTDRPTPSPVDPEPVAWSPIGASGPSAREDHTWTVDPDGATAYLFGGRDGGTVFGDLWAFDLESDAWTELTPAAAPPARFGHEAAWVDGIGLVIFAGQSGPDFFNDLWGYDPTSNAWRALPAGGAVPVARYGSCSAVGSDGRLWISHGFTSDGVRFSDTLAYDFAAATWTDETPSGERPVERCLHACWWTDADELALFAGQTTGVPALGDRWVLGVGGWDAIDGTLPTERNLPAHVRLDGSTLVFGGMGLDLGFHDDLWLLRDGEGDAEGVTVDASGPSGRAGSTLIDDVARDRILLFGGRGADGASAETWALTGLHEGT